MRAHIMRCGVVQKCIHLLCKHKTWSTEKIWEGLGSPGFWDRDDLQTDTPRSYAPSLQPSAKTKLYKRSEGRSCCRNALITPDNYGRTHCCAAFQEDTPTTLTYNTLAATSLSSPKIIRHQNGRLFFPHSALFHSLALSPSLCLCLSVSLAFPPIFMSGNSGDCVM